MFPPYIMLTPRHLSPNQETVLLYLANINTFSLVLCWNLSSFWYRTCCISVVTWNTLPHRLSSFYEDSFSLADNKCKWIRLSSEMWKIFYLKFFWLNLLNRIMRQDFEDLRFKITHPKQSWIRLNYIEWLSEIQKIFHLKLHIIKSSTEW